MTATPGTLFTISAPSGAGKTSLVAKLLETTDNLRVSVSHTTRTKREGELDGINYHFVSEATFVSLINQNAFLEHAQVFNHYYGTTKDWVAQQLAQGIDIILEIDWQGAEQIRRLMPDCVGIFILPPSLTALAERLNDRGKDSEEVIQHRLAQAQQEMSHHAEADYIVINDDFNYALEELKSIIVSKRLKGPQQQQRHAQLLIELLS